MTPDRWSRVKQVFQAALDEEPGRRPGFVEGACGGDPEVRREVESLLAAHRDDSFIEPPAASPSDDPEGATSERRLHAGQRLGPYEISALIGSGGMGEVYRARDTRLDRDVAVKVLPAAMAANPQALARFTREAKAVAALSHPNILAIHDVGIEGGLSFAVMELLEGETLRTRLSAGPLPWRRAVEVAVALAEGLAAAHAKGVVHRDLKPDNVFLTPDGQVKILDFGLARPPSLPGAGHHGPAPAEELVTGPGMVMGTVGYMAPEQIRGEEADARSDVFALGCVLYEMLAGKRPFAGTTAAESLASALRDEPARLPTSVDGISSRLEDVVRHCLDKSPGERFQSARDVGGALRGSLTGAAMEGLGRAVERPRRRVGAVPMAIAGALIALAAALVLPGRVGSIDSLAVLPFVNASGDPSMEYLSDGISESLINTLSGLPGLRVMARSAAFRYKARADDPQQVGAELKVKAVLAGRLVRRGDRLVVSTELVDVGTGAVLWGEQYDRSFSDILVLQEEIVRRISENLRLKLSGQEQSQLSRRPTADVSAYEQYLKGRWSLARQTQADARAALAAFQAALQLDPRFAEAHAGLAVASAQIGFRYAREEELADWQRRVEESKRRALDLGADLAETHEALAYLHSSLEFDWERTIEEARRALAIDGNLAMPHLYIARAFYHLGLFAETQREVEAGTSLDPAYKIEPLGILGNTALLEGRFPDAVRLMEEAHTLGRVPSEWWLATAYYYAGQPERAEASMERLGRSAQAQPKRRSQASLASFLAARGERAKARALIDAVAASPYMDHHVAYSLGAAHAQLGQPAEARRWLAQAARTGLPCYPWYVRDPLLAPLRGDPAFEAFMADLQKTWNANRARYAGTSDGR